MDFPLIAFLILLALILMNGVFALAEIAMVSARQVRLQQHAEAGRRGASAALELSRTPARFLSTIQIGITLVGVLSGAFGEATLAAPLEAFFEQVPWLAAYARLISVFLVVVGTTYLSLVLGELAPKQIALTNPERFASLLAPSMTTLSRLAAPLVTLLSKSANAVLRLLRVRPSDEPAITEEEIRVMLTQGLQSGVVAPIEEQIASQAFWLGDQRISALATPRPDILWLDPSDSVQEIVETIRSASFSQYPVADGSLDNLLGIVDASDLLSRCMGGEPLDLRVLVKPAVLVPETLRAYQLLERFKESRTQFALTLDEYGGVQGLVTALDLLESLVGELPEADDLEDPDIVRRDDGSYLLDGLLGIDRFKNLFEIKELPEEQPADYETISGLLMTVLGRIPRTGDKLELPAVILEVIDMDGNRVDKVLATSHADDSPEDPQI